MSNSDIFVKKHINNSKPEKVKQLEQTIASISADSELFKNGGHMSETEYLTKGTDTIGLVGEMLHVHDTLINKDYFPTYSEIKSRISSTSSKSSTTTYVDSMIDKYTFTPIVTSTGTASCRTALSETNTTSITTDNNAMITALSDVKN